MPHRLTQVVDPVGVTTTLDWSDPGRGAGHHRTGGDRVALARWCRGWWSCRVVGWRGWWTRLVAAPMVGYTDAGLVGRVSGVSGAVTEVTWQTLPDGSAAVDRVRVLDGTTGAELSARVWDAGVRAGVGVAGVRW